MEINVKLFAFLQDQLGPSITLDVTNPIRVDALLKLISQRAPQLTSTLANSRVAINQEFVNADNHRISGNIVFSSMFFILYHRWF